ncbi:HSF-type DNA-binding-domain-containing protein [Coniella lustricola]|uniref:HSF-type DNA-binding-domain-containing protein n=1 Tax=Coniella lustricola TaxID=2025994 RepID=A0A2T3ADR4_9PEZI|nr:HSF-type DNA-binding-domain-containing protein [Coniella lustricola]
MAQVMERSPHRTPLSDGHIKDDPMAPRTVPILTPTIQMSGPPDSDPMDITTPTRSSAPPSSTKSPAIDINGISGDHMRGSSLAHPSSNSSLAMPAPPHNAAPAVQGPKIVQTAFIHKLYNMLEDQSIAHLISWSQSEESFVMSPSGEFSKVLAQYFKHTNISSFVRQLNMYGFHKVSDVFHNGSPDHPLWEFKHGQNNFKRGDLVGLREIKRRASRHNITQHPQKPPPSQPGTPAEPLPSCPDVADPRLVNLERVVQDLSYRLDRSESSAQFVSIKNHALLDSVNRLLHINQELLRVVIGTLAQDTPQYKDAYQLNSEVSRQLELIRGLEEPQEQPNYLDRRPYFSALDNAPVSPRQFPQDDQRRSSLAPPQPRAPYNDYRPQVPSNLSITTKRSLSSIGGSNSGSVVNSTTAQSSPSMLRPNPPPPPPTAPLSAMEVPPGSLLRRHTSADIRVNAENWRPQPPAPYASGPPSSHLPSSPSHLGPGDDRLRESLSHYSFPPPPPSSHPLSRPPSPPPPSHVPGYSNGETFKQLDSFQWDHAVQRKSIFHHDSSAPPTRRGSMAHILNNDDDTDPRGDDDRKRKRLI